MSRHSTFGLVLVLTVASTPAPAQVPLSIATGQAPLSLRAALDEALTENLRLVALRRQSDAERLRSGTDRSLAAPTLDARIWQWPLATFDALNTNPQTFAMREELPGRPSNDVATAARDIVNQVTQAYADLWVARQAIAVHQESVELLRQTTDLATARYTYLQGAQKDVLEGIAQVARVHADLITLEEHASHAAIELNVLMNRPPGAPIGALEAERTDRVLPPVEDLQRLARDRHPEVVAARLDIERADTAPAADVAAARARLEVVMAAIGGAVQHAYIRATAASTRVSTLRDDVIPQTEQVLEAARLAYQSERGDAVAVVDVQRMLLDVQLEYFQALSDLQRARADLERVSGVDLTSPAQGVSPEVR